MNPERVVRLSLLLALFLIVLAGCMPIQPMVTEGAEMPGGAGTEAAAYPLTYAAPDCEYGGAIRSIEAVDAGTVKIALCNPIADLPYRLASGQFSISDAGYLEATGGGGELIRQPNGTGPFKMAEWGDDTIVLERFDDYWGDPALSQQVTFQWNEDSAARLAALQSGDVDGVRSLDGVDVAAVQADDALQAVPLPPLHVDYLGINNLIPPFDNPRVRQAVAMALDRDKIVQELYPPGSMNPTQFLPPLVIGHTEGLEPYPYDPEAARAILEEEGVTPMQVNMAYHSMEAPELVAEVARQLGEVGIEVNLVGEETFEDYFGALVEGEVGALNYIGWYAGPEAMEWYALFGRDAGVEFGEGVPEIWDAIDAASALPTSADRQPLYDRINQLLKDNVPMVPVAHEVTTAAYGADVTGVTPSAEMARTAFSGVQAGDRDTFRWMQGNKPDGAYCPDEVELAADYLCRQLSETLVGMDPETLATRPLLATEWSSNDDFSEWTFTLRDDVTFHDGSAFAADDVATSLAVMWDAAHPLHVGRTGAFDGWMWSFGAHLNEPSE